MMSVIPTRGRYGAVLDANVLVPIALCDILLRLAGGHFYRPFWNLEILAETERAMVDRLGISPRKAKRRVAQMQRAFPDAIVHNVDRYDFGLPDPNDEHVLAAAVKSEAQAIVTMNIRDFPEVICQKEDVEAISPDDFLIHQWDFDAERVRSILYAQVGALTHPPQGISSVVLSLARHAPRFSGLLARAITTDLEELVEHLEIRLGSSESADLPEHLRPLAEAAKIDQFTD